MKGAGFLPNIRKRKASLAQNSEEKHEIPLLATVKIPDVDEVEAFLLGNIFEQTNTQNYSQIKEMREDSMEKEIKNKDKKYVFFEESKAFSGDVSFVCCLNWAITSSLPGEIVLHLSPENEMLFIEYLVAGGRYRIILPEKIIDTMILPEKLISISNHIADPTSCLYECLACGDSYAFSSHLKSHDCLLASDSKSSPTLEITPPSVSEAPEVQAVHFAFVPTPSFGEEKLLTQVDDGKYKWIWAPVLDFSDNEISEALQLSVFFRRGSSQGFLQQLQAMSLRVMERKKQVIKKSLSKKDGTIPPGLTFLKYFPGYGYSRGEVGKKVGKNYRITYSDQDKEDIEEKVVLKYMCMESF